MAGAKNFRQEVWRYYRALNRQLPWRETTDPYKIMVSEIMLQQTQASRVVPYYERFLELFPTVQSLATAPQKEVITAWLGLGYNRRAAYLAQAAKKIIADFGGVIPSEINELVTLPGIGANTAGAICAYAFNLPVIFIETNIRKTIIHFFYSEQETVTDTEITKVLAENTETTNSREWYWALVDYGSMLGHKNIVRNSQSKHYKKQSVFEGSNRQLRAKLLRTVVQKAVTVTDLTNQTGAAPEKIRTNLEGMVREGLLIKRGKKYQVA